MTTLTTGKDVAWTQGDGSLQDRLTLADWRRRVATLYGEVRAMAASDPEVALAHWRTVREWLFREHPQSPLPPAERATFRARHFDHDPALRLVVPVEPAPAADPGALSMELPNSGTETLAFRRIGSVRLPFPTGEQRLSVFWMTGYAGGLFIPFRDATNGHETYAAGRYLLDTAKGADLGEHDGKLVVDLNFLYAPSCAHDPRWACPLAPPGNVLDRPVEAGELVS